ncbi:MAG: hypothetical protein HDR88_13355 [Bacteroides sp.]|nr:hypothetical protein [Bacteroides sp.]
MELEDLKSAWKDIEPQIKKLSDQQPKIPTKRNFEVKTKLFWRTCYAAAFTLIFLVAKVMLELWLPPLYPESWSISFYILLFMALISEIYIARLVYRINLWQSTHLEILSTIIRIKRLYKIFELWFSIAIILMIGWVSLIPPFMGNRDIIFIWFLLAVSFIAEYIFYRKNIHYLNEIKNWNE